MVGYFQPVEIVVPDGAQVSIFADGQFQPLGGGRGCVGLLVGQVYRLRITHIPDDPGTELFPSVEVINRLYPPPGMAPQFPIPVHLPADELRAAAEGRLVTRVVYLENPRLAVPAQQDGSEQPYYDVGPRSDPLLEAQALGRPMVIVRTGSRIPNEHDSTSFGFGTPPVQLYVEP
jgi:hypothetical protein